MDPIVTPEEMSAIDAAAPEPVAVLIDRAGAAVARAALAMLGGAYGRRVVVLAGKGNNGADGRAAAVRLRARGVRCLVVDAADAPAALPAADLVIDAAYGTGFRGTYLAPAMASGATPVLAVDVPSGVSGRTGVASGRPLRAQRTVTFAALKPGLLLADGPDLAGTIELVDIGLDTASAQAHRIGPADVAGWLPNRARATHKWKAAAWVVAGSPGMTGAAYLAARAAQRAGAGYVRLSVPGAGHEVDAPLEAVVHALGEREWADEVGGEQDRFGALAVGPGIGRSGAVAQQVRNLVARTTIATVVDGDGLRALGSDAAAVVASRPPGAGAVILTPHDGEFEALAGHPPDSDRFEAVRRLATGVGAIVLLKGPTTIVARPDGRVLVSTAGDARLATAGSGDVLTGIIAALVAQGVAPFEAAAGGALLHASAGDLACRRGLVAGDIAEHVPAALTRLAGG